MGGVHHRAFGGIALAWQDTRSQRAAHLRRWHLGYQRLLGIRLRNARADGRSHQGDDLFVQHQFGWPDGAISVGEQQHRCRHCSVGPAHQDRDGHPAVWHRLDHQCRWKLPTGGARRHEAFEEELRDLAVPGFGAAQGRHAAVEWVAARAHVYVYRLNRWTRYQWRQRALQRGPHGVLHGSRWRVRAHCSGQVERHRRRCLLGTW